MPLLADAGIVTHWGPLADEARELIADFAARLEHRPLFTLKWAQSLDARIAVVPGGSLEKRRCLRSHGLRPTTTPLPSERERAAPTIRR